MSRFEEIESSEEFQQLKRSKQKFIWPITLIFIIYYLILPLMAGYAKPLMTSFVFGNITFGYLYGISFYIVAWGLAFLYVYQARKFDKKAAEIREKYSVGKKGA